MAEEAPPSERTALSLGLVVPSPVPMTESDEEEAPQSAQVPVDDNSDNAEGAAIPIVQAVLVQTAARDDSETAACHRDRLHPANVQDSDHNDCENEAADEAEGSDSELVVTKRRRNNPAGICRPRAVWRALEVIPRSENSDEEIQNRLNLIASTVYEHAGTAYPPGSLFMIINL